MKKLTIEKWIRMEGYKEFIGEKTLDMFTDFVKDVWDDKYILKKINVKVDMQLEYPVEDDSEQTVTFDDFNIHTPDCDNLECTIHGKN